MKLDVRFFLAGVLIVALGTLIALAVAGLLAKQKLDEYQQSSPLLRLFG